MPHWTEVQLWRDVNSSETVSAGELIKRYGKFLREHELSLIDRPKGTRIRMSSDGSLWEREKN